MKKSWLSPRKLFIPIILVALLVFLAVSLTQKPQAPDVTFTTLQGKTIPLSSLQGKVVLVNFWATDCPGCIAEMPQLIETYRQYRDRGFEVMAVAMAYDPPNHVLNYATSKKLPFPVMHDGYGEIAASFDDVNLTPTAFIIDQQGRIISHVVGELNFNALHAMLDERLGKPADNASLADGQAEAS